MPLTIWTNQAFPAGVAALFREQAAPHTIIWSADSSESVLTPAGPDPILVETADVAFGQPNPQDILAARRLKLVCLSSAGYTRYDNPAFRQACQEKRIVVCNASRVYADPCAQHLLAFMLSAARSLPMAAEVQATTRMKAIAPASRRSPRQALSKTRQDPASDHWPTRSLRKQSIILQAGVEVLLVGYGAIARRIAELLAPFGMSVRAFRRTPRGDEVCPTHPISQIDEFLPRADHVVNILPLSDSTWNFFDAERFSRFKPGARYYNIGRGDTNDQAALVQRLSSGAVALAYLDVTSPEPLPRDHPLWLAPNCYITPHTAGGTRDEFERQVAFFVDNLRRFDRNESLLDRII